MADIRRATHADLDALVALGRGLHAESPSYGTEPFEPEAMRRWFEAQLTTNLLEDARAVFVATRGGTITGVLCAALVPRWCNSRRVAAEVALYVMPEHRGGRAFPRLVQAYRAWAKQQGATKAYMGVSTGIHPERTVHAYERLGFKLDGYNVSTDL